MGNNASSPKASGSAGHAGHGSTGSTGTGPEAGLGSGSDSGSASPAVAGRSMQYHQQLQQQQQQQFQDQQQKASRNPTLVQNQRVGAAAPPEPSMAYAQGSTAMTGLAASTAAAAVVSGSPVRPPVAAAKPTDIRARPMEVRGRALSSATRPVDVPHSRNTSASSAIPATVPSRFTAIDSVPVGAVTNGPPTVRTDSEPPLSPYAESADVSILHHNSMQDMSFLTRPPRLPLPIQEEVHTPGSPIIAPRKVESPLEEIEALDNESAGGGDLMNRSSTVSSATVDEEDMEELRVDKTRPTVPTRLEWLRGGDKVYVTGTIFLWNKKQRLHPVDGRPGVFATTINVLPGTHHIRFLVDGQVQTSRDLPTTVDFGNNLVNYIEVAPLGTPPKEGVVGPPGQSVKPPTQTEELQAQAQAQTQPAQTPAQMLLAQEQAKQKPKPKKAEGAERAQASLPPLITQLPTPGGELRVATTSTAELTNKLPRWKNVPEASMFSNELPKYLMDYDQPEDSPNYPPAAAAIEMLPPPPSLPGFLGKPILNAATLIKDDNSVLNMPNHSVLNHLATSSIKNNILAVSATTRYKDKFVTHIIYKPTNPENK